MRQLGLSLAIMLTLVNAPAGAEIVEVPLPALHGLYWQPYPDEALVAERFADVRLPAPPSVIYRAWFAVRGTAEVGEYFCTMGEPGPLPWVMSIYALMRDQNGEAWTAIEGMPEQAGQFEWTAEFEDSPFAPASWDFLLDGEAEIRLWGAPIGMVIDCSGTLPAPAALVEEAVLYVEGEFPVQVESSTWGKLKSLYR
jgi:hypothetical protein